MQAATTSKIAKVPRFLQSLYNILHDEDSAILAWSADGSYFQVLNVTRLEREVLPKYFKHGKFTSFQRQLNNFSFRKWTKTRANVCTFSHDVLVKCHPSQLSALVAKYMTLKSANATPITTRMDPVVALKRQRSENASANCNEMAGVKKMKIVLDSPVLEFDLAEVLVATPMHILVENLDVPELSELDWSQVTSKNENMILEPLSIKSDCDSSSESFESLDWDVVFDCLQTADTSSSGLTADDDLLDFIEVDVDVEF